MAARLLKDPATAGSRIFIGHLQTEEMNRNELEEHFSKYGTIVGSLLNRGFGFVQFEDEQAAQNAIKGENGAMFKGRRIDVKPAKKDGPGNQMGGGGGGSGGGGGGGFGGNDNFNSNFGGRNQNFNNSNTFGNNDNQFNKGGSGGFGNQSGSGGSGGPGGFGSGNQGTTGGFGQGNQGASGGFGNSSGQGAGGFGGPGGLAGFGGPGGREGGFSGGFPAPGGQGDNFDNQEDNFDDKSFDNKSNDSFNLNKGNGPPFGNNRQGPGNQNRNQNNSGGPNQGGPNQGGPNQGGPRQRGNRAGKQKKARDMMRGGMDDSFGDGGMGGMEGGMGDSMGRDNFRPGAMGGNLGGMGGGLGSNSNMGRGLGNNFRDRSPLDRSNRMDDKPMSNWEFNKPGSAGLGSGGQGRGGFGGGFGDHKSRFDDFKGSGPMRDSGPCFGPASSQNDYPSIAAEKNDCEIIVVNKILTDYAELIESRLKKLGLTVDLLFPNEDVPLNRVLGNIASRGCLYAIVVAPINKEHHSLTLNILHGLPQEHRNMPVDDAITLIMRDFNNYKTGGRSVPANAPQAIDRHPDAIQVLLNMLADNLQLTVLQYDRVIKYLEMRREEQMQFELGEDAKNLGSSLVSDPKQAELQSRILNILNSNKSNSTTQSTTSITPAAAPSPVPPPSASLNTPGNTSVTASNPVTPSPLLNDPGVQKALDNLLQGNLLKNIGDQPPSSSSNAPPLFAAFNMNRF